MLKYSISIISYWQERKFLNEFWRNNYEVKQQFVLVDVPTFLSSVEQASNNIIKCCRIGNYSV